MKLVLHDSLMFVPVSLTYGGATLQIEDILVDTGSTTTLLSIDCVTTLGIHPEASDSIRRIRGVGGVEYVFSRRMDAIAIAGHQTESVELEFGGPGKPGGNRGKPGETGGGKPGTHRFSRAFFEDRRGRNRGHIDFPEGRNRGHIWKPGETGDTSIFPSLLRGPARLSGMPCVVGVSRSLQGRGGAVRSRSVDLASVFREFPPRVPAN